MEFEKDNSRINILKNEEELFTILNALPYATLLIQEDQKIYFANSMAHELVGDNQLTGLSCSKYFCKEKECICLKLENEKVVNQPENIIRKDKTIFPVIKTAQPIILNNKKYFLETLVDNSIQQEEQKELQDKNRELKSIIQEKEFAEEKARKESEKFEQLFEEVADAIVMHDLGGWILKVNRKATDRLGYSKKELESLNIRSLHPPESQQEIENRIQTLMKEKFLKFESESISRDGEKIPVEIFSKVITFDNQEVILSSVRDIAKRKEYEQELIEAKRRSEESDKLKAQFLSNISHEIRTPLNGIVGFLDFLEDEDVSADQRKEFLGIMRKSSDRLIETVSAILEISKMDSGLVNIKKEEFKISEELDIILDDISSKYTSEAVNFSFKISSELINRSVRTDKSNLRLILKYLIDNAFKFTPQGDVSLVAECKDHTLIISIEDSGVGIHSDELEDIFKPFRKSEESWKNAIDGNGLGLTLARKLVHSLGGEITVVSQPGKGSVFTVVLPDTLGEKKSPQAKDACHKRLKNKTILVVEDEMSNYLFIEAVLQKEGANIIHACDGEQALKYGLNGHRIDLILMDLRLPKLSGFEVTKEIKRIKPDIPIIAHSAFVLNNEKRMAVKSGCDGFLAKPVKPERLLSKINQLLS